MPHQKAANAPPPKTGKEALKKAKFDDKMAKFESGAAFQKPAKNDTSVGSVASLAPAPEPRLSLSPLPSRSKSPLPAPRTHLDPCPFLTSEAQGAR